MTGVLETHFRDDRPGLGSSHTDGHWVILKSRNREWGSLKRGEGETGEGPGPIRGTRWVTGGSQVKTGDGYGCRRGERGIEGFGEGHVAVATRAEE